MRRPARARPAGAAANLNIAPLIDAVFLLLTYFLFTISLATVEGVLPSELTAGNRFEQQRTELEKTTRQAYRHVIRLYNRTLARGIDRVVFPLPPVERGDRAPRS